VANSLETIRAQLADAWLPSLYQNSVRSQRTRAYHLDIAARENRPEILHTLLGVELKVGNKRFACPDLPTARYLRVFARLGCTDFAVPYDITKISVAADELDIAWHRMNLVMEKELRGMEASAAGRQRAAVLREIRREITDIGPGDIMPAFDRETRQRKK
jgi:hypothetical protein